MTHDTFLLLQRHLNLTDKCDESALDDANFLLRFPRLEMVVIQENNTSENHTRLLLHVGFYKPVSLDDLYDRCRLPWSIGEYYGLGMLGTYVTPDDDDSIYGIDPDDLMVHEITKLVIHPGAGIVEPHSSFTIDPMDASWIGMSTPLELVIQEQVDISHTTSTLEALLALARQAAH